MIKLPKKLSRIMLVLRILLYGVAAFLIGYVIFTVGTVL